MTVMDPTLDPNRMEKPLSEREIAVRDVFVSEYMKDFDAFKACIRMGFLGPFALEHAKTLIQDGYVLRKIDFLTRSALQPSEEDKAAMLANLRWLAHNGSTSSRTSASKLYMEAQGYIKREGDGEEERMAQLAAVLAQFASTAPA